MKVELSAIDQSLKSSITDGTGIGYNESIGHHMIEHVELLIGGKVHKKKRETPPTGWNTQGVLIPEKYRSLVS